MPELPTCPWDNEKLKALEGRFEYVCDKHGEKGRFFWDVILNNAGNLGSFRWTDCPS
jgi:hypothetical protein